MKVVISRLEEGAKSAQGTVVIVDVFRAFSCMALLFHFGVKEVFLVQGPEEAFKLKGEDGDLILIGEVEGRPIAGFDLPNSPYELIKAGPQTLKGKRAVYRSSSGVQGALLAAQKAEKVLVGGYLNARATALHILESPPREVHIVAMGWQMRRSTPEDEQCAQYLAYLLRPHGKGPAYDHIGALKEILGDIQAMKFLRGGVPHFPPEDPVICLQRDLVETALVAHKERGRIVVRPHNVGRDKVPARDADKYLTGGQESIC